MTSMGARKIGNLIAASAGQLSQLRDQCRQTAQLDSRLREVVPAPWLDHVRLVIATSDRVVLEAESSAWLTRLRFHLPQLKKLIRRELNLHARKVEIRVAAPLGVAARNPTRRPFVSEQTARLLDESARSIGDPGLSAALRRLARRTDRNG